MYALREALAGFRRARFAAFASTSALTVALVIIGACALVGLRAHEVRTALLEQLAEAEVFLHDDVSAERGGALRARIAAMPGVSAATYVSRDSAEARFLAEFGGEMGLEYIDGPFLPASIVFSMGGTSADADSLGVVVTQAEAWPEVESVAYDRDRLARVQAGTRWLLGGGLGLGGFIALTALFLVANTIRLTVYARRLLIRTMKLVGATDAFVRRPFVLEGVLQGLLAGAVAGAAVWGVYAWAARRNPPYFALEADWYAPALAGALALLGVALGYLAAFFAARRFIRTISLH
jgi:cell division transport system permease protein